MEDKRNHSKSAVDLQRTSLHLWYLHPDLREISSAHHNLADYLSHVAVNSAEQRAHRLTAALLSHLTGNTPGLARALGMLVAELRSDTSGPDTPALPATLRDVIRLVEADNGVCLGNLVVALCPEPTTAEHALADLLSLAKQGR